MREIKFRAWVDNEMKYNIPISEDGKYYHMISNGFAAQYDPQYKRHEVMQYTGLKDKNGVEIWENDRIVHGQYHYEVSFKDGCFCVKVENGYDLLWKISNHCEVIGNIYENTELLK